jgi:hypothetical protein
VLINAVFRNPAIQDLLDGSEKLWSFAFRELICELIENSVYILANEPLAVVLVVVNCHIPYQGALKHCNASVFICRKDSNMRMGDNTE